MPEEPQDILTISLLKLEEELTTFGKFQNALVNAREDLKKAEQEWATLTKEQQQSALTLVNATKTAIETTNLINQFVNVLITDVANPRRLRGEIITDAL